MSSFSDCINKSSLSKTLKAEAIREFEADVAAYTKNGKSRAEAEAEAGKSMFDSMVERNAAKKGAYIHNMRVTQRHIENVSKLDGVDLIEYGQNVLNEAYVTGENSFAAVVGRHLADAVNASSHPVTGSYFKSQSMMDELVHGRYGSGVDGKEMSPVIRNMVKSLDAMEETVEKLLRQSGVVLKRDSNWMLPQYHNASRMLGESNRAAWIDMHMRDRVLDWDNMGDFHEGRVLPTTDAGRRELLSEVYNTIVTGGVKKINGGQANSTASKYTHRRFLRYATSDAWLAANKAWGDDDILGTLVTYSRRVGRDIAMMQNLGTNPKGTVSSINSMIDIRANELDKARKVSGKGLKQRAESAAKTTDSMYRVMSFAHKDPKMNPLAATVYVALNFIASARLTATSIPALFSDRTTTGLVKKRIGLSQSGDFISLLFSKKNKVQAIRLGAGIHTMMRANTASERMMGEIAGPNWSRSLPEFTVRFTQLANLTTAGRQAFQTDAYGMLGDLSKTKFSGLPKASREWMERYKITEQDWNDFRATPKLSDASGGMLPVIAVLDRTDISYGRAVELFRKFGMAVDQEMERAIPTMTLRAKVAKGDSIDEGSALGVFARSGTQFMGFSLSMVFLHILPNLRLGGMASVKATGATLGLLTLAGAVSLQAKAVIGGKDPEDMQTFDFWYRAALQGGGLGFVGDLFSRGVDMLKSPLVRFLTDTGRLTTKAWKQVVDGHDAGLTGEFISWLYKTTPAVDAWQVRLISRWLIESAIEHLDPRAATNMRYRQSNQDRKHKTTRFRERGELPDRMPEYPFQ